MPPGPAQPERTVSAAPTWAPRPNGSFCDSPPARIAVSQSAGNSAALRERTGRKVVMTTSAGGTRSRGRRAVPRRRAERIPGPEQRAVDELLEEVGGGPRCPRRPSLPVVVVGQGQVLDHVEAAGLDGPPEHAEAGDDLAADVAAVINDDVERTVPFDQAPRNSASVALPRSKWMRGPETPCRRCRRRRSGVRELAAPHAQRLAACRCFVSLHR